MSTPYFPVQADSSKAFNIQLGVVNTSASGSVTAIALSGSGFSFSTSDVGAIVMIFDAGSPWGSPALNQPFWTTIAGVTNSTHATLAAPATAAYSGVQVVLYRTTRNDPYSFILTGSVQLSGDLSTRPTLNFTLYSRDGSVVPIVGQPVLMTHPTYGDVFGGSIDQVQVSNLPGVTAVNTQCQCVSWDQILSRRLIVMTSLFQAPATVDTFAGSPPPSYFVWGIGTTYPAGTKVLYGTPYLAYISIRNGNVGNSPASLAPWWQLIGPPPSGSYGIYNLSKPPAVINSMTVNGSAVSYGIYGTAGVHFWWTLDQLSVIQVAGTPLTGGDTLVVNYNALGMTPATGPMFNSQAAGTIITELLEEIAAEGITLANILTGPVVDTITFDLSNSIADACNAICSYINNGTNNYWVYVDARRGVHFEVQGVTTTAPWNISQADGSNQNVLVQVSNTITREKLANAVFVNITNALASSQILDVFIGDGTTTSFNTLYPIGQTPLITLAPDIYSSLSVPQTVAVSGSPSGTAQWYFTPGSTSLTQDSAGPVLTGTEALHISYTPGIPLTESAIDSAAAALTAAIEGGTGEYDSYLDISNTLPYAALSGSSIAQNLAAYYAGLSQSVQIQTYRGGLLSGQSITVDLPLIQAVGTYVVDSVSVTDANNLALWTVTLANGAVIGDWKKAFLGLSGARAMISSGGVTSGAAGAGGFTTMYVTLAGADVTVASPSASSDGQQLMVKVKQDGTLTPFVPGHVVNWSSAFVGVTSSTVPTTPQSVSWLTFGGSSQDGKWHLISSVLGRAQ